MKFKNWGLIGLLLSFGFSSLGMAKGLALSPQTQMTHVESDDTILNELGLLYAALHTRNLEAKAFTPSILSKQFQENASRLRELTQMQKAQSEFEESDKNSIFLLNLDILILEYFKPKWYSGFLFKKNAKKERATRIENIRKHFLDRLEQFRRFAWAELFSVPPEPITQGAL